MRGFFKKILTFETNQLYKLTNKKPNLKTVKKILKKIFFQKKFFVKFFQQIFGTQYLKISCIAYHENLSIVFICLKQTFLKIWCNLAQEFRRNPYPLKNRFLAITSQKIGLQSPTKGRHSTKLFYIFCSGNIYYEFILFQLTTKK